MNTDGDPGEGPTPATAAARRRTDEEPNTLWRPLLIVAFAVAALDWSIKANVAFTIPLGGLQEVMDGRVAFWHVQNTEMILGLWGGFTLEARQIIALAAGLAGALLAYELIVRGHRLPPRQRPWVWWFGGLAFGGMLGNLGERVFLWGVTDYLSLRWGDLWLPPGNVADIALFLSIPLALPVIHFELRARSRRGRRRTVEARPETVPAPGA